MLSERLFNNRTGLRMDYNNVATIIFSHPPIGTVGLSEKDAKAQYGDEKIKVFTSGGFTNMFYSPAAPEQKL